MNQQGRKGRSPLSHAAQCCKVGIMKILLDSDTTEADRQDSHGKTPLSWAAACSSPSEETPICDAERRATVQQQSLRMPLKYQTVDVNSIDKNRRTPLMAAVAAGNKVAIQLLLSHEDTEINGYSRFGETPLVIAIEKEDLKIVEMRL